MRILPITSWLNGEEKKGTEFNLRIISDNLSDCATFYYEICTDEISHVDNKDGIEIKVIDIYSIKLIEGNLVLSGINYHQWDADPSANAWAYNWAASKLNLELIPK